MKKIWMLAILIAGVLFQAHAQYTLPEITVMARNYKYLRAVDNPDKAQPIRLLEHKAASYDVLNSEFYSDEYDTYSITFYLPSGYVLAVYDSEGKLISTAERFKKIALPAVVRTSVTDRFPGWSISDDTYLVKYADGSGKQVYKMLLANGRKRMRVKTNEQGEFLD